MKKGRGRPFSFLKLFFRNFLGKKQFEICEANIYHLTPFSCQILNESGSQPLRLGPLNKASNSVSIKIFFLQLNIFKAKNYVEKI